MNNVTVTHMHRPFATCEHFVQMDSCFMSYLVKDCEQCAYTYVVNSALCLLSTATKSIFFVCYSVPTTAVHDKLVGKGGGGVEWVGEGRI